MRFLVRILITAAALALAAFLIPGISAPSNLLNLLLVALVFGVLNAVIRPILRILTCPLQIITLGLFTLVLNAFMLWLTGALSGALGLQFQVDGFIPALLGGIVVSVVSILLSIFVPDSHER